jgi:hypothetical protein
LVPIVSASIGSAIGFFAFSSLHLLFDPVTVTVALVVLFATLVTYGFFAASVR